MSLNPITNFRKLGSDDKPRRKLSVEETRRRVIVFRVFNIIVVVLFLYIVLYGNNSGAGGHQCSNSTSAVCLW